MESPMERYEKGLAIRTAMAGNDPTHFAVPGMDQLAPDLKRIVDECLFGSIWSRPGLDLRQRCVCSLSAVMATGHVSLLPRHLERSLNLGLTPDEIVEVLIQLTFYVGVPAVEAALRTTYEVFQQQGVQFTPTRDYDIDQSFENLYETGVKTHEQEMGTLTAFDTDEADPDEVRLGQLINGYHWGAIYNRPHLDAKSRTMCALAVMAVKGQYDRQIRRRIEGALHLGLTPLEIMEVFIQVMLYGGYFTARTSMRIARSVFSEKGLAVAWWDA